MRNLFFILFLGWTLFFLLLWEMPDNRFHIYFLDVGQGDSILIKTPQNHQILIDGGGKTDVLQELAKVMSFFDRSIDMVILSHPHDDHIAGLVEVLKRYRVNYVLFTGIKTRNNYYDEFLDIVENQKIPYLISEAKTDFKFGEVSFDILYPFSSIAGKDFKNLNNSSIALRISYQNHNILLTGDLEKEAELEMIKENLDLKAQILKAGHHGSKNSSTMEFLKKVQANTVVIQSGKDNSFGHPHDETLRNLYRVKVKEIRRNDEEGLIEFIF